MKAAAYVRAELDTAGRTVLRTLRSAAPLTLLPHRNAAVTTVHLVGSGAAPVGGDDLTITVEVGAGAQLRMRAVAATIALPGQSGEPSRTRVRITVDSGGDLDYQPEPTIVTARAHHIAELTADIAPDARVRLTETLVLGRTAEPPGRLDTSMIIRSAGRTLLNQQLTLDDVLAGHRVLTSEFTHCRDELKAPLCGDWWSHVPLPFGGTLRTALSSAG